ncbi:uncharacterized protein YbjT (DUF2867 family) [Filimonas zeae]|uniref:Nucleotide-diphosphate-sugar epimerase n=1 Tax=Filimonas zeae TaxID=1737353 RepID=A0A917IZB8_9BACT|nr:NAD(P)H-binding protein [Filimonas zeae]MDR6340108.1 uncharacterized protein YbjT (DUF2867 family) [Filimonas zeae]GGH71179.1 nucleotide-diphosphate-sugar epimerase [Filimonas zeae]
MKIAIGAATGNIGSKVATLLAQQGHETILLGRSAEKLQALAIPNAVIATADIADATAITAATQNVDALFWLVPPGTTAQSFQTWYQDIAAAGAAAVTANYIPRVVTVSCIGAGAAPDLGTVTYAAYLEEAFNNTSASVVHLRPGYFMDNFLLQQAAIEQGYFTFPYAPDHDIPFISSEDIAAVAAGYLADNNWSGKWTRNLMGPANITPEQAAGIFTEALGKPVVYQRQSNEELQNQLQAFGLNKVMTHEIMHLYAALGDTDGVYATPRTAEAYTPTTLRQFIQNRLLTQS